MKKILILALSLAALAGTVSGQAIDNSNTIDAVQKTVRSGTTQTFIPPMATLSNALVDQSGNILLNAWGGSIAFPSSVLTLAASGAVSIGGTTTPSLTTAAALTNTGFLKVNGKTSGSLKITTADATAQAVTITAAAQTSGATTLTIPDQAGVSSSFVFTTLAQTLTNKTFSGEIESDIKVLAADFTAASGGTGSTLTSLSGLSWTVVAGKAYKFRCIVPLITQTTNGGGQMAFKLTTTTLTSVNLRVRLSTDTDNTGAVSTNFTTTTDQATWFNQKSVVYTNVIVEGSFVVGTGGTIAVQAAQNTSHADTTTITAGAYAEMVRTN